MTENTIMKINENTYISLATLILLIGVAWFVSEMNSKINSVIPVIDKVAALDARISALEYKDQICQICKSPTKNISFEN